MLSKKPLLSIPTLRKKNLMFLIINANYNVPYY